MDPFSLSVGIAGLAGLVATTVSAVKNYLAGAKNAKTSIAALITELEMLQSTLSSLDQFINHSSTTGVVFQENSVLRSCMLSCETRLKTLSTKLARVGESRTRQYLWPLNEKEHQNTMQELRAFGQCIQFSLSVDGRSLLSRTSHDVLQILERQLESFRALQNLEDQTVQLQEAVKDQARIILDDRNAKRREEILNWLSNRGHDQKHHAVRSARIEGTGIWLLERPEYVRWRDDIAATNVLWCHGIQGSGKTVLTYVVLLFYCHARADIAKVNDY